MMEEKRWMRKRFIFPNSGRKEDGWIQNAEGGGYSWWSTKAASVPVLLVVFGLSSVWKMKPFDGEQLETFSSLVKSFAGTINMANNKSGKIWSQLWKFFRMQVLYHFTYYGVYIYIYKAWKGIVLETNNEYANLYWGYFFNYPNE